MDKKAVGDRIKKARSALNITQDVLSQRAKATSKRGLQDNEAGKAIPGGAMIAALVESGINANWLLTGDGPMMMSDLLLEAAQDLRDAGSLQRILEDVRAGRRTLGKPLQPQVEVPTAEYNGFVAIPIYHEIEASAGHGALPPDIPVAQMLKFSEDWIRHELRATPSDLYLINVDGDSMEPTLRSGDVILVDHRVTNPNREGVYILRMDGALLVKRLQFRPGEVIDVISDNKEYSSFAIKLADMAGLDFAVLGKVVWSGRRM